MCLTSTTYVAPSIDSVVQPLRLAKPEIGYKWFQIINGKLHATFMTTPFVRNEWIEDKHIAIIGGVYNEYHSGFHICKTEESGLKFAQAYFGRSSYDVNDLLKVEYDHIVAIGEQSGCEVIVARRIKVF